MMWDGWIDAGGFVHEEGWKEEAPVCRDPDCYGRCHRPYVPPEGHGLYPCVTCGENVTRYGRRCDRCERNLEEDRLERESGR